MTRKRPRRRRPVERVQRVMVLPRRRGKPDDAAHRRALIGAADFRREAVVPALVDFRGKR
mgnify:CR=1 FL=1